MNIYIYTLTDPRTNEVRYIGKTVKKLENRLYEHIKDSERRSARRKSVQWIRGLIKNGFAPKIDLIDIATKDNWEEEEKFYITYFKFLGFNLLNMTEGGDGCHGRKRAEIHKRTLSDIIKNNPEINEKRLRKLRERLKGKPLSKELREQISKRAKGRKLKPEQKINWERENKKAATNRRKKIGQFDVYGNKVAEFMWVKDAAKSVKIGITGMYSALNRGRLSKGHIWKYV